MSPFEVTRLLAYRCRNVGRDLVSEAWVSASALVHELWRILPGVSNQRGPLQD
jgi:hypothetical protein